MSGVFPRDVWTVVICTVDPFDALRLAGTCKFLRVLVREKWNVFGTCGTYDEFSYFVSKYKCFRRCSKQQTNLERVGRSKRIDFLRGGVLWSDPRSEDEMTMMVFKVFPKDCVASFTIGLDKDFRFFDFPCHQPFQHMVLCDSRPEMLCWDDDVAFFYEFERDGIKEIEVSGY